MTQFRVNRVLTAVVLALSTFVASAPADEAKARIVAILLWDGAELIEFTGPAQIFEFTPGFKCVTVGPSRKAIRSYFVSIFPEYTYDDCPQPDVIVVSAGVHMMKNEALAAWLRRVVPKAQVVLSVCNGSLILANAGLLDGQIATGPHASLDDLMILGKDIRACANERFVESGKFVTANSYFAGVDAALHVVSKVSGPEVAQRTAARVLYDWQPQRFADELAKPRLVEPTRRKVVYDVIQKEGVDAGLKRYRELLSSSSRPADSGGAGPQNDENLFRYMAWNLQNARRTMEARKLCEFSVAAFPDSAMARACLGEAYLCDRMLAEAITELFRAADMKGAEAFIAGVLHRLLRTAPARSSGADQDRPITAEQSQRARRMIREAASRSTISLIPEAEPGEPLIVSGLIRDGDGAPLANAIVYAYQTDTGGFYSNGIVAAPNGKHDDRHPRLFGFARTGADGRYELRTILPASYENAPDMPRHIHFHFGAAGYGPQRPEGHVGLYFADDPKLVGEHLAEIRSDGARIAELSRDPDGTRRCTYDFVLVKAAASAGGSRSESRP